HFEPQSFTFVLVLTLKRHHVALETTLDDLTRGTPQHGCSCLLNSGLLVHNLHATLFVKQNFAVPFTMNLAHSLVGKLDLAFEEIAGLDAAEQRLEFELDIGRVACLFADNAHFSAELHRELANENALAVGV